MKNLKTLNELIMSNAAPVYITGKPGIGKSAIVRDIAQKNSLAFFDLRLSQLDETDLIGIPRESTYKGIVVTRFIPQQWLIEANEKPSLLFFDELNRARSEVRNAALQILNERMIGSVKLEKYVYIVAAGNLGKVDRTDVEAFDSALNNRLIHFNMDISMLDWLDSYGNKNVHSTITKFLTANPDMFYNFPSSKECAFPTPRSWTNFSNYLAQSQDHSEIILKAEAAGHCFVGSEANARYCRFIKGERGISVLDLALHYDEKSFQFKSIHRADRAVLLKSLVAVGITSLINRGRSLVVINNIHKFLNTCEADERSTFIYEVLKKQRELGNPEPLLFKRFMMPYSEIIKKIGKVA